MVTSCCLLAGEAVSAAGACATLLLPGFGDLGLVSVPGLITRTINPQLISCSSLDFT